MEFIENRTFDEINVGDTALLERTLTASSSRLCRATSIPRMSIRNMR